MRIVVGVDDSSGGRAALQWAVQEAALAGVADAAGPDGMVIDTSAVEGPAVEVLLDAAEDADLLVVGTRGRGKLAGLLLGSVSQRCIERSSCPVVVVPDKTANKQD